MALVENTKRLTLLAFSVLMIVTFTTHNLSAGHSPPDGQPDPDKFYIEVGPCHTPNFGGVPEVLSSILELVNPQWSIRHEEPYLARTDGYKPPDREAKQLMMRGFYNAIDGNDPHYLLHVGSYLFGVVIYIPGMMIDDTHTKHVQERYNLQKRYCTMVYQAEEGHLEEEIAAGVPLSDHHRAHDRFLNYGWEHRKYHLFLQNCQHWTEWVIAGIDTTGLSNPRNRSFYGIGYKLAPALLNLLRTWFPGLF